MLRLAKVLAANVAKRDRLAMVPPAVIEEIIDEALDRLANIMPMATPASEVNAIEFEFCEVCSHAIDPENAEGSVMDVEGIWLCAACAVDETAVHAADGDSSKSPRCVECRGLMRFDDAFWVCDRCEARKLRAEVARLSAAPVPTP